VRTVLRGWRKYKEHPNLRIRARFAHEAANLPVRYAGVLWATRRQYRDNPKYVAQINELLSELHTEFGWQSYLAAPIAGRYLYRKLKKQQEMLDAGWTYEPPTFYETNYQNGPPNSSQALSVLAPCAAESLSKAQGATYPLSEEICDSATFASNGAR
jgi:hypothetical protein